MNVQQSKQAKITLTALALVFAAMLVCMPQLAFAGEAQVQGTPEAEQAGDKAPDAAAPNGAKTLEAQQAAQPLEAQATVDQGAASPSAVLEAQAASTEQPQELSAQAVTPDVGGVGLSYDTHVQNDGWQAPVTEGQMSGTEGRALRLEGIHISLTGMDGINGSILYQTHVQNDGWQDWKRDGEMSGTEGRALRLEGIRIKLEGDIATQYDVFYRTHVQNIGWQGWQCNGALSGTTGQALRLEGIEIKLSPKTEEAAGNGSQATGIRYETHVQNIGWQEWVGNGEVAGTTGQALQVEAFKVVLSTGPYYGGIEYTAHVQNKGWMGANVDLCAGTTGQGLRVEALTVKLTGDIANYYDVYYRTHVQSYGWLDWACNGTEAGSTGHALQVEALQIVLVKKGAAAPGPTDYPTVNLLKPTLNGIDISSWQAGINLYSVPGDFVIVKATGGTGYTNPYFWSMAEDTLNSGKLLGLYHFARESGSRSSARAEADHFVDTVQGYVGTAVLVLDYEAEAINQGPDWAEAWLDRVYERTGVRPVIYMSKSVANEQDWSSVASKYRLWGAQYLYRYYNNPQTGYVNDPELTDGWGPWGKPSIYQYNSTSYLDGYDGSLDMDVFYGSAAQWHAIAAQS